MEDSIYYLYKPSTLTLKSKQFRYHDEQQRQRQINPLSQLSPTAAAAKGYGINLWPEILRMRYAIRAR